MGVVAHRDLEGTGAGVERAEWDGTVDRVVQGVSVMRKSLSTAIAALAVVAGASFAPPAPAVGTGVPVVVSPANGTEVPAGFDGPVAVDFTEAAAGTYQILVGAEEGGLGDVELATVEVDASTTTVQRALPEPLDKGGVYRVLVRTGDPGNPVDVASRFTVLGGEDPVILSPGRSVPLGYAGPLLVDFTTAPVGYYDLTLSPAAGGASLWWEEMLNNHEDRTLVQGTIDPIMQPGKYVFTVTGTSNNRGYDAKLTFNVRRR